MLAGGFDLTNYHVIEGADEIDVSLSDGRKAIAKLVGTDPETDLAVIKIDLPNLPAITFGHSELASVGDVACSESQDSQRVHCHSARRHKNRNG